MLSEKNKLVTYPIPKGVRINQDFSVRVREENGEWIELSSVNVKVDMHDVRQASMVSFDFSGTIEVEVKSNLGSIDSTAIRPLSYGIEYTKQDDTIRFKLTEPRKLSVEINGDRYHNLHIFGNHIESNIPDPEDRNVLYLKSGIHRPQDILAKILESIQEGETLDTIYFAPGMHYIEEIIWKVPSRITVYIAGGAAVVGSIVCENVEDVSIRGRGCLYLANLERFTSFRGIRILFSKHMEVEGITVVNPPHYSIFIGQSEHVKIQNFKAFSCEGWSDGIDAMSSSYIEMNDVFLRTSDDCIAIYGRRWDFNGNVGNITVKNSVLWADVAHPLNIGGHGDYYNDGNIIENILYENIDILEHHEPQLGYLGCMAINVGDNNTVRNIRYKNIRVEQFENGRLFDLRVLYNPKYNPVPGRRIENIYFKDIIYNGVGEHPAYIQGYDEEREVDGVTFENLRINGKHILAPEEGNIFVDHYTKNIHFK